LSTAPYNPTALLTREVWNSLVEKHIVPAYQHQLTEASNSHFAWVFSELVRDRWTQHKAVWAVRRVASRWQKLDNLCAMLQKAAAGMSDDHSDAYEHSPEYKALRAKNRSVAPEHEVTETERLLEAIRLVEEANVIARELRIPVVEVPAKWLEPDEKALAEFRAIRANLEGKTVDELMAEVKRVANKKAMRNAVRGPMPDTEENRKIVAAMVRSRGSTGAIAYFGVNWTNAREMVEQAHSAPKE
jgi:hypothetical protein